MYNKSLRGIAFYTSFGDFFLFLNFLLFASLSLFFALFCLARAYSQIRQLFQLTEVHFLFPSFSLHPDFIKDLRCNRDHAHLRIRFQLVRIVVVFMYSRIQHRKKNSDQQSTIVCRWHTNRHCFIAHLWKAIIVTGDSDHPDFDHQWTPSVYVSLHVRWKCCIFVSLKYYHFCVITVKVQHTQNWPIFKWSFYLWTSIYIFLTSS